jgi:hypothetical protein
MCSICDKLQFGVQRGRRFLCTPCRIDAGETVDLRELLIEGDLLAANRAALERPVIVVRNGAEPPPRQPLLGRRPPQAAESSVRRPRYVGEKAVG